MKNQLVPDPCYDHYRGDSFMSIQYEVRQCTVCGGTLEYISDKRVWRCPYCGNELVQTRQNSALFGIQSAVRQALSETAHRRFDSALHNLNECERLDSRYVGTLIARIAYQMMCITTPGGCSDRDARNLFTQLKKNQEILRAMGSAITAEERDLYGFLEEADIFGMLLLVFDHLGDAPRRDEMYRKLEPSEVYSCATNNNLLSYALKNGLLELADKVLTNVNNLDTRFALNEVLQKYPDSVAKTSHIARLMKTGSQVHAATSSLQQYLSGSRDDAVTKAAALENAVRSGMDVSLEFALESVIPGADPEKARTIISAFCARKLCDADVDRILGYACSGSNPQVAAAMLDCLIQSGQYAVIPSKLLIGVLSRKDLDADGKLTVLQKLLQLRTDTKAIEGALNNYLCFNSDSPQTRVRILPVLLEQVRTIPTATVQQYVLKCAADGASKPDVMRMLFDKELNLSYYQELLASYMTACPDPVSVRSAVIELLTGLGLKAAPNTIIDYLKETRDTPEVQTEFIRKLVDNGTQPGTAAANLYLEKTEPDAFRPETLTMLLMPGSSFSPRAVERYLLRFRDEPAAKVQTFRLIAQRCSESISNITCLISHAGNTLGCSLLQAYVLLSSDSMEVTGQIVDWLVNQMRLRINAEMSVSGSGMRFRKYVRLNRGQLSPTADGICEQLKVYSMLF